MDSLLDQGDFKDYEIILVDDGATDSSGAICDEYASKFDLVRVLHKENGGLSSARNAGIKIAKGDYIMFVDSDDYIKTDVLAKLIEQIYENQLDILVYNFAYLYEKYNVENNTKFLNNYERVVSGKQYVEDNLKSNTMHMMACNKVYKRTLIIDNQIFFRDGYVHEDEEWSPRIFSVAQRVMQTDLVVYGYYIRSNSISNSKKKRKSSLDLIDNCKRLLEFSNTIVDNSYRNCIQNNIATLCLSAYYNGRMVDQKEAVLGICEKCNLSKRNTSKYNLLKKGAKLYLFVNDFSKRASKFKEIIRSLPGKFKAVWSLLSTKLQKNLRKMLVLKSQRKNLSNHTFSIIASSCNGGVITSELGEQFRTPTINLWFTAHDFIKLCENLKYYMSLEVEEVENNFCSYPVGRIDDIMIYFMHYHTFDEAKDKWNQRKARINYDDLCFMMAQRDGCGDELVERFENLPYSKKVIFTANEYPQFKSSVFVEKYAVNGEVEVLTDFVGMTKRKYDDYFDYVKWLNRKGI